MLSRTVSQHAADGIVPAVDGDGMAVMVSPQFRSQVFRKSPASLPGSLFLQTGDLSKGRKTGRLSNVVHTLTVCMEQLLLYCRRHTRRVPM